MLILPIKRKWFNMILSGEKREEYREMKPYWEIRLRNYFGWTMEYKGYHTTVHYQDGIWFGKLEDLKDFADYFECHDITNVQTAFEQCVDGYLKFCQHIGKTPEKPQKKSVETTKKVLFRNGYGNDKPYFIAECSLRIGIGKEEWGAEPGEKYYILEIKKIPEQI